MDELPRYDRERTLLVGSASTPALTAGALRARSSTFALALSGAGIGPGDVVATLLPNSPAFVVAMIATWQVGAVFAPLNPGLTIGERASIATVAQPRVIIASDVTVRAPTATLRAIPTTEEGTDFEIVLSVSPTRPSWTAGRAPRCDDALLLFTSGSTGQPKGVPLTSSNVSTGLAAVIDRYGLGADDSALALLPWSHGHGLIGCLLASLYSGGSLVPLAASSLTRSAQLLDLHRPTWLTLVPPLISMLVDALTRSPSTHSPRFLRSASATLPPATAERAEDLLHCPVSEAYGMTETSHQAAANPATFAERFLGTVGWPTGTTFRFRSDSDLDADLIEVRGPAVFDGYLGDTAQTAQALTNDGWYSTGDLGVREPSGAIRLLGRLGDLVNRGGYKVAPVEVELALAEHPAVSESLVTAVPHPILGEDVLALVVVRPGHEVESRDLAAHCRERLADFKRPGSIRIVDALPRLPNGKLSRRLARSIDTVGR